MFGHCINCTGSGHTIADCPYVCANCGLRTSPEGRGEECMCAEESPWESIEEVDFSLFQLNTTGPRTRAACRRRALRQKPQMVVRISFDEFMAAFMRLFDP